MSIRTPSPPKLRSWKAYRVRGAKAAQLGLVEAPDVDTAIAAAAEAYGVDPKRVLVQQVGK